MGMVIARYTGRATLDAFRKGSAAPERFGPADAGTLVEVPSSMLDALERMGVVSVDSVDTPQGEIEELRSRLARSTAEVAELRAAIERLRADNAALAERLEASEAAAAPILTPNASEEPDGAAPEKGDAEGGEGAEGGEQGPPAGQWVDVATMSREDAISAIRAIDGAYQRFTESVGPFRGAKIGDIRDHLAAEIAAQP